MERYPQGSHLHERVYSLSACAWGFAARQVPSPVQCTLRSATCVLSVQKICVRMCVRGRTGARVQALASAVSLLAAARFAFMIRSSASLQQCVRIHHVINGQVDRVRTNGTDCHTHVLRDAAVSRSTLMERSIVPLPTRKRRE